MDEKDNWKHVGTTFQLFGYENAGGRNTQLWKNPFAFRLYGSQLGDRLDEDFAAWLNTKRPFTEPEVVEGTWLKICELQEIPVRKFRLLEDHTFSENDLFKPQFTWSGTWEIVSGVLFLKQKDPKKLAETYMFSIYAAKDGLMHSGVDGEVNRTEPYAYFKIIHLP